MQLNSKSDNSTTENIKKIIAKEYNKNEHGLNLGYRVQWRSVLGFRDWSVLRSLYLDGCNIDGTDAQFLGSLSWPNLQILDLVGNNIKGMGVKKLLANDFPQLEQLWLYGNNINDEGMQVLSIVNLPRLKLLNLDNKISAKGMFQMPNFKAIQLKEPSLRQNSIGSVGIKLLIKAQLNLLQELNLIDCKIGDEGAKQLAKGWWPNLSGLDLVGNLIKFEGCASIITCNWKELEYIEICSLFDKNDAVDVLNLMTANWPKCRPRFQLAQLENEREEMIVARTSLVGDVKNIMSFRFGKINE